MIFGKPKERIWGYRYPSGCDLYEIEVERAHNGKLGEVAVIARDQPETGVESYIIPRLRVTDDIVSSFVVQDLFRELGKQGCHKVALEVVEDVVQRVASWYGWPGYLVGDPAPTWILTFDAIHKRLQAHEFGPVAS